MSTIQERYRLKQVLRHPSEGGYALVTALFVVGIIAMTTLTFLRVNERLATRVRATTAEIRNLSIDEEDLAGAALHGNTGSNPSTVAIAELVRHPRLSAVKLKQPTSNLGLTYLISDRVREDGFRYPNWSYLSRLLTPIQCHPISEPDTGGICTANDTAIQTGLFIEGDIHKKNLTISAGVIPPSGGGSSYVVVAGDLQIDGTLELRGEKDAPLVVLVVGRVIINALRLSGHGTFLILAAGGQIEMQNILDQGGALERCDEKLERAYLRLEGSGGVKIGDKYSGPALGCDLIRDEGVWPTQLLIGKGYFHPVS